MTATRDLGDIDAWSARANVEMTALSGKTPAALRVMLAELPLVLAPMVVALTSASCAAIQRNLAWIEQRGLIWEVTSLGRYRMWRAAL